jgi:hypothetical protein
MSGYRNDLHEGDDLWSAIYHNTPDNFVADDVEEIMAEVPGENDEYSWWWVLRLKNGKHVLLEAGCDYTGWDCQSGIYTEIVCESANECATQAPAEHSGRKIQDNLMGQLRGDYPKFTLWTGVQP